MAFPLFIVVLVSMLKDAFEDYKRHKNDAQENEGMKSLVFKKEKFEKTRWRDIRVGDVVKVLKGQAIPADMVIIKSSGMKGSCYVETKNLDGETNLKIKQAHKQL
mmetsp:Transcript_18923/g.32307  ORF Transcript_18923/g.32307 Transcript_18923/m.32307 type:complete len:105 (+) Transcript_18923:363-677(+)